MELFTKIINKLQLSTIFSNIPYMFSKVLNTPLTEVNELKRHPSQRQNTCYNTVYVYIDLLWDYPSTLPELCLWIQDWASMRNCHRATCVSTLEMQLRVLEGVLSLFWCPNRQMFMFVYGTCLGQHSSYNLCFFEFIRVIFQIKFENSIQDWVFLLFNGPGEGLG